ncbi:MAG: hypothetical protein M3Q49_02605 [Actinomycetota bacterium]|nr:hypothetical protein [Actinomycetota bacterium]PLS87388.1 MAG: hypothetical protein CYG60_02070 [Actinomycetota bacterium]
MSEERQDPEMMAYTFSEHIADQEGDAAQEYLVRFVDELLTLEPGLAERMTDAVLTDLAEEIARREDPKHAHATIELIRQIEEEWRRDA